MSLSFPHRIPVVSLSLSLDVPFFPSSLPIDCPFSSLPFQLHSLFFFSFPFLTLRFRFIIFLHFPCIARAMICPSFPAPFLLISPSSTLSISASFPLHVPLTLSLIFMHSYPVFFFVLSLLFLDFRFISLHVTVMSPSSPLHVPYILLDST